jgi:hypothetical protein
MLKIENPEVLGWEHSIRGMRNPMNSWEQSDSEWTGLPPTSDDLKVVYGDEVDFIVGPADQKLMMQLRIAGTDHRKFMRMLVVYLDITAPLYWWKEFDTYKVGTVANSCSTMHKIHAKEFTLDDFLEQLQQVKSMGPIDQLIGMIPGVGKQLKGAKPDIDEKELAHVEAIIKSMTQQERRDPAILNGSRKKRIARGSGTRVQDVNRLVKQFEESRRMMKQLTDMTKQKGKKGSLKLPF